jgi:AraC-like DNA-binding protein
VDKNSVFGLNFTRSDLFIRPRLEASISTETDQTIAVSPLNGNGFARRIAIGDNSRLVFLDLQAKEETSVSTAPSELSEEPVISATCVLTPAGMNIGIKDDFTETEDPGRPFVVITLRDPGIVYTIAPNQPVKAVFIQYPYNALRKKCKAHDQHLCSLFRERTGELNWLTLDHSNEVLHHKLIELDGHAHRSHADTRMLAAQTRSLLVEIIRTVLGEHRVSEENERQMYVKMDEIRSILSKHLESKLPSLPVLAKKVEVSESTLKRNFKSVFGTSIYEYYLQSKMEWARQLFHDRSLSVKEVAFRLGYEKPSSFIKIFKRIYHYPPGELRRRQLYSEA